MNGIFAGRCITAVCKRNAIGFCISISLFIVFAFTLLCSCDIIKAMRVKAKPVTHETLKAIHDANLWLFEDSGLCPGSKKKDYKMRNQNGLISRSSSNFWIGMSFAPVSSAVFSVNDATGMREILGKKGVRIIEAVGEFGFCIGNGPTKVNSWVGYSQSAVSRVEFDIDPNSSRILRERYYFAPPPPPEVKETYKWEVSYEYGSDTEVGKLKRIVAQDKDTSKDSKTMRFEMTVIHRGDKILLDKSEYYFGGEHSSTYTPAKGAS